MVDGDGGTTDAPAAGAGRAEGGQRGRWLTGAAELAREFMFAVPADPPRLIVERVREIADADLVAIVQQSADDDSFVVRAWAGADPAEHDRIGEALPAAVFMSAARAAAGRPVSVAHIVESGLLDDEAATLLGVESAILVPIAVPGRPGGLLVIGRRPHRPEFTGAELSVATLFAAQVALALELA